jgi:hypothetical protein
MAHIDEVGKFWIVTYPRKNSKLADICFEMDVIGLIRQVLGGLSENEIAAVYQSKAAAHLCANRLLNTLPRN